AAAPQRRIPAAGRGGPAADDLSSARPRQRRIDEPLHGRRPGDVCSTASCRSQKPCGHEWPRLHQRVGHRVGCLPGVQGEHGIHWCLRIWYLKQFDAYCAAHDRTVFDKDTVEGWVGGQLQRCGRYRSWMSYIRDVGRWMTMNGIPGAYVLSDRWKAPIVAAHPYLLARREIELFFTAAAQIQTPCPWRWQAVAFFTLMHSC